MNKSSLCPLVYKHGVLLTIVVSLQTGNNEDIQQRERFIVLILKWNSVSQNSVCCRTFVVKYLYNPKSKQMLPV